MLTDELGVPSLRVRILLMRQATRSTTTTWSYNNACKTSHSRRKASSSPWPELHELGGAMMNLKKTQGFAGLSQPVAAVATRFNKPEAGDSPACTEKITFPMSAKRRIPRMDG